MNLKNKIIRHNRFMDAAILVQSEYQLPHKRVIKGRWINMGFVESYDMHVSARIELSTGTRNWEYCEDTKAKCIRYADWSPLAV